MESSSVIRPGGSRVRNPANFLFADIQIAIPEQYVP
jgi:hypothetical protein